jgi:hypothetical protein
MVQAFPDHQKLVVYLTDLQVSVLVVEQQHKCYGEDLNSDQESINNFLLGQGDMAADQEAGLSIRLFATFSLN